MGRILSESLLSRAQRDAEELSRKVESRFLHPPEYVPDTYYRDLTRHDYFDTLITVRHYLKETSDAYFSEIVGAKNVDLFMFTPSASSPMGPGSDSEAVPIKFGNFHTYLVDSSQFGFEPLLFRNIEKVYCYLPSMRGEDPDARHLNQFYHCEAEIVGTLQDLMPIVEGYVKALAEVLLKLEPLVSRMSLAGEKTTHALEGILQAPAFSVLPFEAAYQNLASSEDAGMVVTKNAAGRNLTAEGEKRLAIAQDNVSPLWITGYDRAMVAFYQKPDPEHTSRVLNADLIFPPLTHDGFGGEIAGAGQRQDVAEEMLESLALQGVDPEPYQWYIELRRQPGYRTTAGFGLGLERFIAWALGYSNIRDVIPYPRLKNVQTYP